MVKVPNSSFLKRCRRVIEGRRMTVSLVSDRALFCILRIVSKCHRRKETNRISSIVPRILETSNACTTSSRRCHEILPDNQGRALSRSSKMTYRRPEHWMTESHDHSHRINVSSTDHLNTPRRSIRFAVVRRAMICQSDDLSSFIVGTRHSAIVSHSQDSPLGLNCCILAFVGNSSTVVCRCFPTSLLSDCFLLWKTEAATSEDMLNVSEKRWCHCLMVLSQYISEREL